MSARETKKIHRKRSFDNFSVIFLFHFIRFRIINVEPRIIEKKKRTKFTGKNSKFSNALMAKSVCPEIQDYGDSVTSKFLVNFSLMIENLVTEYPNLEIVFILWEFFKLFESRRFCKNFKQKGVKEWIRGSTVRSMDT